MWSDMTSINYTTYNIAIDWIEVALNRPSWW